MSYDRSKLEEVKSKISIPMYFYNIIIPQMSDYYSDYIVDFDNRPVAKCPLHDEDTPSMRFYEETNTFYCFGCRAGGDVIELHRRFVERLGDKKPSFGESIEFLHNFFIRGKIDLDSVKLTPKLKKVDKLSNNVELIKYYRYSELLEGQLLIDTNIPENIKYSLWNSLDEIDILVSENEMNATKAIEYIKNLVKINIK